MRSYQRETIYQRETSLEMRQVFHRTPDKNAPADSKPAYERAALLWHGKSLWCRHCFAGRNGKGVALAAAALGSFFELDLLKK